MDTRKKGGIGEINYTDEKGYLKKNLWHYRGGFVHPDGPKVLKRKGERYQIRGPGRKGEKKKSKFSNDSYASPEEPCQIQGFGNLTNLPYQIPGPSRSAPLGISVGSGT